MSKDIEVILTPEFRVSFPQVFEAKAFGTSAPKFSVVMLFLKTEDLSEMKNLVMKVAHAKWGNNMPEGFINPFKDGDKKDYEGYKGHIAVTAKTTYPIGVLDEQKKPIINPRDFYAGCYALATVNCFAYFPTKANPLSTTGVAFGLQNVMKLRDGESLGGGRNAESDFESIKPQGFTDGEGMNLDIEGGDIVKSIGGGKSILDL